MPTTQFLDSAQAFFTKGVDQSRQSDFKRAIESLDQALQLDFSHADAYGYRCVARYWMGDMQGVIADCQQALTIYLE